jgi:baculoviral IAP repeat-containing protein 6
LQEIVDDLTQDELPAGMAAAMEQSCVVPMLELYLKNDSIVDMERQQDLYMSLLSLCAAMVRHIDTAKLLLLLPNQKVSLHSLMLDMEKQAKIADKFDTAPKEKGQAAKVSLAKRIVEVAHAVNMKLRPIIKAQQLKDAMDRKDEKSENKDQYVVLLKDFRFKEVREFKMHHYWNQQKDEKSAVGRTYMRRLQHEYADLSKSLPIFSDSSIFMRVQEGNMSLAQILVVAPTDTPYSRGCFLFDVYFPPSYPSTPPLVNLQTTGNNTVRFNPNLYNSGKVCLSLLGTWSGSKEEQWNPKSSTFLQVCVSLQSLIFVSEPYFNEPGYEKDMGSKKGKDLSDAYNSNIRAATVRWAMIDMLRNPPQGFEYVVLTHFFLHKDTILKQVEGWCTDGVSKGAHLASLKALVSELKGLLAKLEQPAKPSDDSDDEEN